MRPERLPSTPDPLVPQAQAGLLYEVDPVTGATVTRPPSARRHTKASESIVAPTGDRTGDAIWLPLDRTAVQIDADAEATRAGATGYGRPEDVELATSTGNARGGSHILFVAVTDEHRVLRIDLHEPQRGAGHSTAFVSEYVRSGVNAPADFNNPDNLALDKNGNLYITEDTTTPPGIWTSG